MKLEVAKRNFIKFTPNIVDLTYYYGENYDCPHQQCVGILYSKTISSGFGKIEYSDDIQRRTRYIQKSLKSHV